MQPGEGSKETPLQPFNTEGLVKKMEKGEAFSGACSDRTKSNVFRLKEGKFRLDIRNKLTVRVGEPGTGCPQLWIPHVLKCSWPDWMEL